MQKMKEKRRSWAIRDIPWVQSPLCNNSTKHQWCSLKLKIWTCEVVWFQLEPKKPKIDVMWPHSEKTPKKPKTVTFWMQLLTIPSQLWAVHPSHASLWLLKLSKTNRWGAKLNWRGKWRFEISRISSKSGEIKSIHSGVKKKYRKMKYHPISSIRWA